MYEKYGYGKAPQCFHPGECFAKRPRLIDGASVCIALTDTYRDQKECPFQKPVMDKKKK